MADSRLRKLERRYKETGAPEDELAWLRARLHQGDLPRANIRLAAYAGHTGAVALCGIEPTTNWIHFDKRRFLVAIIACKIFRRWWNLHLPVEDPLVWLEKHGGTTQHRLDEKTKSMRLKMSLDDEHVATEMPLQQWTRHYPAAHNHPVWHEMLRELRMRHYREEHDYIAEPLIWELPDVIDQYRTGKITRASLMGYNTFILGSISTLECYWAGHLLGMTLYVDRVQEHYETCLTICLEAPEMHAAINKGVVEWALK